MFDSTFTNPLEFNTGRPLGLPPTHRGEWVGTQIQEVLIRSPEVFETFKTKSGLTFPERAYVERIHAPEPHPQASVAIESYRRLRRRLATAL